MGGGEALGAVGVVGAGAAGSALARALSVAAYPVVAVSSRSASSARRLAASIEGCRHVGSAQGVVDLCDTVLLAVPDDAIAPLAESVRWREGQAAVHCSGASPLSLLDPARDAGAATGALHPLQTFSSRDTLPSVFRGVAFGVEAGPPLLEALEGVARDLGGWPVRLGPADRALYHASAVAVCGLLAALVDGAAGLWEGLGDAGAHRREDGLRALLPLVRGTVEGMEARGLPAALTGPIARGDVGTVGRHLEALSARAPGFVPIYARLALAALPLAAARGGLDPGRGVELERMLRNALEPVPVR